MTPGDFTWYALTTCTALLLLWPMHGLVAAG